MAGRGPAPKPKALRRNQSEVPTRGEWRASPGIGWQHGPLPEAPVGLLPATAEAWTVWFRAWFAAHWTPDDLPGLRLVIQLYDQVQRAFAEPFIESEGPGGRTVFVERKSPSSELRQMLDNYGISPKGQQDRRWAAPKVDAAEPAAGSKTKPGGQYDHLRVVG